MRTLQLTDTIVAVSSAPGPSLRAIIRLSGPDALDLLESRFQISDVHLSATFPASLRRKPGGPAPAPSSDTPGLRRRLALSGDLRLSGVSGSLPAVLFVWPKPHSYTGQNVAELHTISCPPLVDQIVGDIIAAGARAAGPGEFTLRAFLAGKLDLPRAEAVHGVIAAADRGQLRHALSQLAGGVTRPLDGLRDDLLNLLADIEAELDFSDEDISFVSRDQQLIRIGSALARFTHLRKQLDERAVTDRPYRVALIGQPNAGKSSLFNALLGRPLALVSELAGTTRDYLTARLEIDGVRLDLFDTAGLSDDHDPIGSQAQSLGHRQSDAADLLVICTPAGAPMPPTDPTRDCLIVATQCDRAKPTAGLPTSALTGQGLEQLKREIVQRARARQQPALASSEARCRAHVEGGWECLRRAHLAVVEGLPAELLALELRSALEHVGALVGAVYTDDLLDRIFSRFCIGK